MRDPKNHGYLPGYVNYFTLFSIALRLLTLLGPKGIAFMDGNRLTRLRFKRMYSFSTKHILLSLYRYEFLIHKHGMVRIDNKGRNEYMRNGHRVALSFEAAKTFDLKVCIDTGGRHRHQACAQRRDNPIAKSRKSKSICT